MFYQTMKLAIVAIALTVCGNVSAQDCGCGGGFVDYGGSSIHGDQNCGRGITQGQAASLWAGYCNENCGYSGGCDDGCNDGCGKFGGRRGLFGGGNGGASGCGCNNGCFGYPTSCGGCGDTGGYGGGLLSKFGNRRGNDCGCGTGGHFLGHRDRGCAGGGLFHGHRDRGCGCGGGLLHGHRDRGCGCGTGLFSGRNSGWLTFGFHRSRNHCGSTGAYFSEAVGHEYGNAGFQSAVSGCATNCCGGYSNANVSGGNVSYGVNNAVGAGCGPTQSIDPSYGAPMMPNNAYTAPAANGQGVVGDALMPNDAGMNNDAGQTEQPETENLGEIEQLAPNGLIQDDNN